MEFQIFVVFQSVLLSICVNKIGNIIFSEMYPVFFFYYLKMFLGLKNHTYILYHTYRGMTMHSPAAALISVRCGRDNVCVATLEQR